jgi:hypothetical protein
VVFDSPTLAVLAASAAQDELWKHNQQAKDDERLELRVAVSAGEVALEKGDVLGEPVTLAASLREQAGPGDVWLTEAVQLVASPSEVKTEAAGELSGQKLFKVPRSASGAPFGGQGMTRAVPLPTGDLGPALTASAMKALSGARRLPLGKIAAAVAAVLVFGAGVVLWPKPTLPSNPLQTAINDVRTAIGADKSSKIVIAQGLIAKEPEAAQRDYWYGKLQAAQDDDKAAAYFRSSIKAGYAPAEEELINLLRHPKCFVRQGAIDAIVQLKLMKAKLALTELAEKGMPDDTEKILFFGCNSKQSAGQALRQLTD